MRWLQLDPESVVQRVRTNGGGKPPSLGESLLRGVFGFTVVSVAGFAPWAVGGAWLYERIGEAGLYGVCALVFIAASGLFMHRLIIGPGSLSRFYLLFAPSFALYSVAWIAAWMLIKGHPGSIVGLLAGTALMGGMFAWAFDAKREIPKIIAVLFLLNAFGYFAGGILDAGFARLEGLPFPQTTQLIIAKSLWGVCYGVGFGAGLGLVFHLCQTRTRSLLQTQMTI